MYFHRSPNRQWRGFSLVELLIVISIITAMATLLKPVISALTAGNTRSAQVNAQSVLEGARQFACTNRTYVRVGFAQVKNEMGTTNIAIQTLYSTTGDLRNDTSSGFDDQTSWKNTNKPILLPQVTWDDTLVPASVTPLTSGTDFPSFTRKCGGQNVTYSMVLQFDPQGQISLMSGKVTRSVGLGFVNPHQPNNPVVLLLSGLSGKVQTYHREEL